MIRRFSILLILVLALAGLPSVAFADEMPALDLPPGIAMQAQPLIAAMMDRMQEAGMSHEQMHMMMADMQGMAAQLPPGIFLQILRLMPQLDMADMMTLHQAAHQGDLLQLPPGQILRFVRELAR